MARELETAATVAGYAGPVLDGVGGPLGLVGRFAGLGGDELDAGVPGWAWFGVGVIVGAAAMYGLRPRVEAFLES